MLYYDNVYKMVPVQSVHSSTATILPGIHHTRYDDTILITDNQSCIGIYNFIPPAATYPHVLFILSPTPHRIHLDSEIFSIFFVVACFLMEDLSRKI